ncbi:hypothetical protein GWO43_18635 [candidate division KSB1 bacterium]|nr:hypothetical protein [candidate division KSB1 bacterium]NIR70677.1 hypothetical protein [candidate division KSB1 bacterium]NIS26029.1 hypothetical protein [candidate division KSB1 bacterium]NIT72853.1 hypothetical protein [candidate division KSB1 bacterium]NIU26694.1 hypothetical protein [candidate division KSB1 bacterium]
MSDELIPIIIVPAFFFSVVAIIKIISDNALRKKIIETGVVDENIKYLYANRTSNQVPSSLKWGMILIAVGAAILVGQLVPYSFQEEATISGMLILAGVALIVYYFLASRMMKKSNPDRP